MDLIDKADCWDQFISPTLFAYRTSKQSTTGISPFYLTYGREALLPSDESSKKTQGLLDRITSLLDDLPLDRYNALERINRQQNKQKAYHDQRVANSMRLNIRDKVLLYHAEKEKQWSGKMEPKWKGRSHFFHTFCYFFTLLV